MDKVRAHVVVYGRVQGVAFRYYAQRVAAQHGICGWIRNRADGSVEMVIEGGREAAAAMIRWCHQGPPMAIVTEVKVDWLPYTGEFHDFSVRFY